MTGLETGLLGGMTALVMFGVGRVSNFRTIRKETCERTHKSLAELLETKFENLYKRLDKIDKKLE
jgi:hypothetical protein